MNTTQKTLALAVGGALALSVSTTSFAETENPFAIKSLSSGYQVADNQAKGTEGKCSEGKCAEGKCAGDPTKAKDGKCGEGKCGAEKAKETIGIDFSTAAPPKDARKGMADYLKTCEGAAAFLQFQIESPIEAKAILDSLPKDSNHINYPCHH